MIHINIEIKNPSRLRNFIHKIHNHIEDITFNLILRVPDKFIPISVMNWLEKYIDRRTANLKHQIIRDRWQTIELEKVIDNIHSN